MSNQKDIAADFAAQTKDKGRAGNVFFEGPVCYSYGYHYPMAVIRGNRAFINADGYSKSTARQTSRIRQACSARGLVMTDRTTDELKELAREASR